MVRYTFAARTTSARDATMVGEMRGQHADSALVAQGCRCARVVELRALQGDTSADREPRAGREARCVVLDQRVVALDDRLPTGMDIGLGEGEDHRVDPFGRAPQEAEFRLRQLGFGIDDEEQHVRQREGGERHVRVTVLEAANAGRVDDDEALREQVARLTDTHAADTVGVRAVDGRVLGHIPQLDRDAVGVLLGEGGRTGPGAGDDFDVGRCRDVGVDRQQTRVFQQRVDQGALAALRLADDHNGRGPRVPAASASRRSFASASCPAVERSSITSPTSPSCKGAVPAPAARSDSGAVAASIDPAIAPPSGPVIRTGGRRRH